MNQDDCSSHGTALRFYGDSYRFPGIYHATRFPAADQRG